MKLWWNTPRSCGAAPKSGKPGAGSAAATHLPPRLEAPPGTNARWHSMAWHLGILLAAIAGAMVLRAASDAGWLLPVCTFRQVTGVPCPGCGSTRALTALANADLLSAFRLNPMATGTAIGLGILWFARFLEIAANTRLLRGVQGFSRALPMNRSQVGRALGCPPDPARQGRRALPWKTGSWPRSRSKRNRPLPKLLLLVTVVATNWVYLLLRSPE